MKKFEIAGIVIYQFIWNFIDSNAYIIMTEQNSIIIDPINTREFWDFIDEIKLENTAVILTHEHFDHICGLNELRERMPCTVYAQKKCSQNIGCSKKNLSSLADVLTQLNEKVMHSGVRIEPFVCKSAEIEINDKLDFSWMGHKVSVITAPGHSKGSVCVVVDDRIVFTGDSLLYRHSITKLPGGCKEDYSAVTRPLLFKILQRVEMVFPGHGEPGDSGEFCGFI